MKTELTILLLPESERNKHNGPPFWSTVKFPTCFFCNSAVIYNNEFAYAVASSKELVCEKCVLKHDPQIRNIMWFINKHTYNEAARLDKFKLGIPKLRELIAADDPTADKCPICEKKKVHYKNCLNCGFHNLGSGLFRYEDKVFNYYKAKRAYKMKAFF